MTRHPSSLADALDGTDARLDQYLADWSERNPDGTILVLALSPHQRARVAAAHWRVFGCPMRGWITGP